MPTRSQQHGHRGILAAVAVLLALGGVGTVAAGLRGQAGPPAPPLTAVSAPAAPATVSPAATAPTGSTAPLASAAATTPTAPEPDLGPILAASLPVALDIPSIGVHTTGLVPLEVGPDGVLPPPADPATAGYYAGGPTPGQLGPAVIAAHVDSRSGPAVFYRLGDLKAGALVHVTRQDGSVATFTVDTVARYAKADFPTQLVYGSGTDRAEIRLITCGGAYNRGTGHYVDDVVVFGHLDP